ncbi:MAG: Lon-like protease helical domain-containing protein [Burkholderiaceae bacterium]
MIETELLSSHRVAHGLLARRTDPAALAGILDEPNQPGRRPSLVGHERAARSIDYAFNVALPGYNLFVMGPSGIGKSRFVREAIVQRSKPAKPRDWVYLHNFAAPDKPIACTSKRATATGCERPCRRWWPN